MTVSNKAQGMYSEISDATKLGDIKKIAKEIKKDHQLAMDLWATAEHPKRLLAILIMDKKELTQAVIENLIEDLRIHTVDQRNQLTEWLLANQLTKSKKTIALLESWQQHPMPQLQRLFWYYQARLRWTGQTPPNNTQELMDTLEKNMASAHPEVQWAMNFCAGQIGTYEPKYRARCIKLGETTGLYKDEPVSKGCTPSYLPEFISIQSAKVGGN